MNLGCTAQACSAAAGNGLRTHAEPRNAAVNYTIGTRISRRSMLDDIERSLFVLAHTIGPWGIGVIMLAAGLSPPQPQGKALGAGA